MVLPSSAATDRPPLESRQHETHHADDRREASNQLPRLGEKHEHHASSGDEAPARPGDAPGLSSPS